MITINLINFTKKNKPKYYYSTNEVLRNTYKFVQEAGDDGFVEMITPNKHIYYAKYNNFFNVILKNDSIILYHTLTLPEFKRLIKRFLKGVN